MFAVNDAADLLMANSELCRKRSLGYATSSVDGTDISHLIGRQLLATPSSFHYAVDCVLAVGAKKKMSGIDAMANVAPMKNTETVWDFPNEHSVCDAMSHDAMLRDLESAISQRMDKPCPQPTACLHLVDLGVEAGKQFLVLRDVLRDRYSRQVNLLAGWPRRGRSQRRPALQFVALILPPLVADLGNA